MAKADSESTTTPLSKLFRDPLVRDAFERAERDFGSAFAVLPTNPSTLAGGAAENMEVEHV